MAEDVSSEGKIQDPVSTAVATTPAAVSPAERKQEIAQLIERDGIFSINFSELGRKFGVTHTQIHRDVEDLMSEMKPMNWVALFNRSLAELEHTIGVVNKAMEATSDTKKKGNLASQLSEMVLRKASLLERMDHLLPSSMKPEPVRVTYHCVDPAKEPKKDPELPVTEPAADLVGVPSSG